MVMIADTCPYTVSLHKERTGRSHRNKPGTMTPPSGMGPAWPQALCNLPDEPLPHHLPEQQFHRIPPCPDDAPAVVFFPSPPEQPF